jgi:3-oxoacyl-[acyl-carrier protein] reductase
MTKTMAKEWGRYKICVNCVAFGFIDTRLTQPYEDPRTKIEIAGQTIQAGVPAALRDSLGDRIPLGRAGTAEEAASAIAFFCSPESNYVSGETLVVGGGIVI